MPYKMTAVEKAMCTVERADARYDERIRRYEHAHNQPGIGAPLLTVKAVATQLGVSQKCVRDRIRAGKLKAYKLGDALDPRAPVRIKPEDIEGWVTRYG